MGIVRRGSTHTKNPPPRLLQRRHNASSPDMSLCLQDPCKHYIEEYDSLQSVERERICYCRPHRVRSKDRKSAGHRVVIWLLLFLVLGDYAE